MTTSRRFCRFVRPSNDGSSSEFRNAIPSTFEIPAGGICISAFLALGREGSPRSVLLGRVNPDTPWDELGAIGGSLLERAPKGWMIPSSHLMLFESPKDSARRILKEQIGLANLEVAGPLVFSDVYDHPAAGPNHWDICYIFKGEVERGLEVGRSEAWYELRFVDLSTTRREELVRSHSDVLEAAGLRFGP